MKPIDMLQELQSWHSFTNTEMERALASKANASFKAFVKNWEAGRYDDDISQAKSDFLNTLDK